MSSDLRQRHILVVDDDVDTRELYELMLGSVGYAVELADSVRTARELLRRSTPDVVITDWRLPDGNGFSVSDALHARVASRRVPVVGISGLSMTAEIEDEARARGFTAVLLKPVSPNDILSAISAALEIATARELRHAAVRLRRYAAQASKVGHDTNRNTSGNAIDAAGLLDRAAARSGENIALMLADDTARYVAAAGGARELTGYEPQELVSLSVWDLTPSCDAAAGEGLWSSFIASGTQEGRYTLRRRDGVAVEAQYCAIANVIPGLHLSALTKASQMPASI